MAVRVSRQEGRSPRAAAICELAYQGTEASKWTPHLQLLAEINGQGFLPGDPNGKDENGPSQKRQTVYEIANHVD